MIFVSWCTQKFYLDQQYYDSDGEYIKITSEYFKNIDTKNYVLFVYNNYCAFSVPCDEIFHEFMVENYIDFLSMPYEEFKNTELHDTVRFAPSVIIVREWKIIDYLDAEKDKDIQKYQSVEEFANWISKYIELKNQF